MYIYQTRYISISLVYSQYLLASEFVKPDTCHILKRKNVSSLDTCSPPFARASITMPSC